MSWTRDLPKPLKRELRALAALAHDRQLAAALTALEGEFARWRAGELHVQELADAVHVFHDGPNRDLWKTYGQSVGVVSAVIAVRDGVIAKEEVSAELLELIDAHSGSR